MSQIALVIDDNALNIEVLKMLLESEGLQVEALLSASKMLKVIGEMPSPQVIFLDLEFPNADGFEMLPILRQKPNLQGVPIVAYSVHTSEIDRARAAGFDGFLGKPLHSRLFPEQLRRILSGQQVWEA